MYIVSPKGLRKSGDNPTMLYGYGAFKHSLTPYFKNDIILWCQHFNGVYAIPNIRGGGAYGEEWHKKGVKERKQNGLDDFHAAAEYLISEGYTCRDRLAIEGASAGGILVAACCNQRPDLYGVGISYVGVHDMLRFQKFTIGYAWCSDFGNADKDGFDYLIKYSPLHNIPDQGPYPTPSADRRP